MDVRLSRSGIPPPETTMPPRNPDTPTPPTHGIDHMRKEHPGAMKISSFKGPKDQGGSFHHVLRPEGEGHKVSLLHQHDSGAFDIYERTHSGKPTPAGD